MSQRRPRSARPGIPWPSMAALRSAGSRSTTGSPRVVSPAAVVLAACLLALAALPAAPPHAVAGVRIAPEPVSRFRWPLDGQPAVVRPFDPPPRPWLPGHRGVDLAAASGDPVRAAGGGVVRFAGTVAGRGVVSVEHPGGLRTTYEPVTPAVRAGDRVAAGDVLGRLVAGHPGCPVAACLHWGLRRGAEYLDPLALLGRARVRLLPLEGLRRPVDRPSGVRRADGPAGTRRAGAPGRRGCRSGCSSATRARATPAPSAGPRRPPPGASPPSGAARAG